MRKLSFVAAASFLMTASASSAATYNVTSYLCTGAGSLQAAITAANTNPGPDVISFTAGLQVEVSTCPGKPTGFFANVTDDVIFEGNGAKLIGQIQWVTTGGLITPLNNCPATTTGTIVVVTTPGFLRVAEGKSVEVKNLSVKEVHSIAEVRNNASLLLEDFKAERVLAFADCSQEPVAVGINANLTLRRNTWNTVVTWPSIFAPPTLVSPAIMTNTNAGNLVIEDSEFYRLAHGNEENSGLFYWDAPVGKTVKIVSTRMNETGGIVALGGVDTFIVNSAWGNDIFAGYASVTDRFVNASTGTMTIAGSTIMAMGVECDRGCRADPIAGIPDSNGLLRALDGRIDLVETAIGVNLPGESGTVLSEMPITPPFPSGGGDIRADARTWIQPDLQTAAELKAISNQPGLLTDAPGLVRFEGPSSFAQFVSPLLGTPANPGKLIDVIADGCTSDELVNPIDGSTITSDVFGNPRCDANGRRNIGAVQFTLSPGLSAVGTGDGTVDLAWTKPLESGGNPVTGYAVFYREAGTLAAFTRIDIAAGDVLSSQIAALSNGTPYEFKVVAVNAVGDGPDSNLVEATPYGPIQAPVPVATPGDGQVGLSWPVPGSGGRPITGYTVFFRQLGSAVWTTYHSVAATSETVHGLVNGVGYEFAVTTDTATGSSNLSPPVTATPSGPASVSLFATAGNESATLAWFPTPVPGAVSHRVEYRLHNLLNWTQLAPQPVGPVASVVSGLLNGQLYDFRVMVLDGGGQVLAASNIASVTPGLQAVLGLRMVVRNPGNDPVKRLLGLRAKDKDSSGVIFGDPTTGDSTLSVIANGDKPTTQDFVLPASGWHAVRGGYRYNDPKGTNGPVVRAAVLVQRNGTFVIHARVVGKNGTVDVVPPNPGLNGGFILDLPGDGRHCVLFDANTIQHSRFGEIWQISKPSVRGCPVAVP